MMKDYNYQKIIFLFLLLIYYEKYYRMIIPMKYLKTGNYYATIILIL